MRRFFAAAAVAVVVAVGGGAAFAAVPESGPGVYKKVTKFDFDDDVVVGNTDKPYFDFITAKGTETHGSLIRVRATFVPEMLRTTNDL
ncbi:MAG TPA: hypothetical protein VG389_28485 [Myxococcota bacterium]|jgi:hypothetical protein|nr:hypothetical protein [Myxococcota bacterium]